MRGRAILSFTLPFEPVSWKAPIIKFFRGHYQAYDTRARHKGEIKRFLESIPNTLPPSEAYDIAFIYHMAIPKSLPKRTKLAYAYHPTRHIKKPDVDNLNKLYIDCFKGHFFQDDACVSIRSAIKIYSNEPKIIVFISPSSLILSQSELNHYKIEGLQYELAI